MKLGSTAATLMTYLIGGVGIRMITYLVGVFCVKQSMDAIQDYMPAMDLQGAFAGLPDMFLFGLWYVDTAYTVAIIVPAYALYFAFGRKSVFGG